jgi:hypothetical protein
MAKLWLGLGGLIVLLAWPAMAQEVVIDGELELQVLVPSEMDWADDPDDTRMGLGPDSVINLEASVNENLSVFWTFNLAKEMESRTDLLTVAPVWPSLREQYYARLTGIGSEGTVIKAGKFNVPLGLRSLGITDQLITIYDTGVRVEWPTEQATVSATIVDGRTDWWGFGEAKYSSYYLGAEGTWGPVTGAVDVAWGNNRGLFGVSAEGNLGANLTVGAEYLNGEVEAADVWDDPEFVGEESDVSSLFLSAAYRFEDSPFTGTVKFRDYEIDDWDRSETKYGLQYQLTEDTLLSAEWWNNSANTWLDDGLVVSLKSKY